MHILWNPVGVSKRKLKIVVVNKKKKTINTRKFTNI